MHINHTSINLTLKKSVPGDAVCMERKEDFVSFLLESFTLKGFLGLGRDDNQRSPMWWGVAEEEFLLGNSRVISRRPLSPVASSPHLMLPQETSATHTHHVEEGKGRMLPFHVSPPRREKREDNSQRFL